MSLWNINQQVKNMMSLKNTLTPKEVAAIQKENLRLKQKIEILKKAITNSPKSNLHRTD